MFSNIQHVKWFQWLSPLFDRNSELFKRYFLSVSLTDPRCDRSFADIWIIMYNFVRFGIKACAVYQFGWLALGIQAEKKKTLSFIKEFLCGEHSLR